MPKPSHRAGEAALGFRPITDFIDEMAQDVVQLAIKISQEAFQLSQMAVEDFAEQISKMNMFHQRTMPSNRAKQDWINRVRQLDIEIMAPQYSRLFKGDDVKRFLDWFEDLEVGVAIA